MRDQDEPEKMRIDKWLWAARFFKTRSLAARALESGQVLLNGARVKPAKLLVAGNALTIRLGPYQHLVEVLGVSEKRGPAVEAQKLYAETEESRMCREALSIELKAQRDPAARVGRPTKRARREIDKIKGTIW